MTDINVKIRDAAAELLDKKEAQVVIGWSKGDYYWQSPPAFIEKSEDVNSLIFDSFSVNNVSKYLQDELDNFEKVAIFVKGCDSRGFNRLIQDYRVDRNQVVVVGVPCQGMVDKVKLEEAGLALGLKEVSQTGDELVLKYDNEEKKVSFKDYKLEKCATCKYPNPVVYDKLLTDEVTNEVAADTMARVKEVEKMPDKFAYWQEKLDRCIRCYACRNVCPACNCRKCIFDQNAPRWIGKANRLSEKQNYQIIRAFHVAGRCVDCGECERVCPMDIPLQEINRKLVKDLNELYGEYEAGVDPEDTPPLGTYRAEDPAGFSES